MKSPLIVLTDIYVQSHLLSSGQILQEFPFLNAVKKATADLGGCSKCQKSAKQAAVERAMNEAKRAIATLPEDRKARFKELLQADQVRVQWYLRVGDRIERDRIQF